MRKLVCLAAMLCALFVAGTSALNASASALDKWGPCLQTRDHLFEVCWAYTVNASYEARLPFYLWGQSCNPAIAAWWQHHFESRYKGQARQTIRGTLKPSACGSRDVGLPTITIDWAQSSLRSNTATLRTHETWLVKNKAGKLLFSDFGKTHVVQLKREPGISYVYVPFLHRYVGLHKWDVYNIS